MSSFDPRAFIAGVEWRFAATMPDNPHEYILESTAGGPDFLAFYELIRSEGRVEVFEGYPYRYLTVDELRLLDDVEPSRQRQDRQPPPCR